MPSIEREDSRGTQIIHEAAPFMKPHLRLGINIDHVATVRNARGSDHPDPVRAAHLAIQAGADGITAHLREDRRHIVDRDIERLADELTAPLNMEMAATLEMTEIALRHRPHAVCIVPERREELTTEGGLDVIAGGQELTGIIRRLSDAGIRVSLFIDPDVAQIEAADAAGAGAIELHTGRYSSVSGAAFDEERRRIEVAAEATRILKLECHAGHGLTYDNVGPVASITPIVELNIGHFLVGEAIYFGFEHSILTMRRAMDAARGTPGILFGTAAT
jgi:pyridoxine 5-phosphate synthase